MVVLMVVYLCVYFNDGVNMKLSICPQFVCVHFSKKQTNIVCFYSL